MSISMKNEHFEKINKALLLCDANLPEVKEALEVMNELWEIRRKTNKRISDYAAEKRLVDKNWGRGKGYIKKGRKRA